MMENFFKQLKNIVSTSETFDRIIILGKGSSVKSFPVNSYENCFVININDSERIFSGNLCVFHNKWVTNSLNESGFRAQNYVCTNESVLDVSHPKDKFHFVNYKNTSHESFDRLIGDFHSDEFYLSDFLVLSALKIAYQISKLKIKKLKIYLLGFDFHIDNKIPTLDFSGHEIEYKNVLFSAQKAHLSFIKKHLNKLIGNQIIHVGDIDISDMSISDYNVRFSNQDETIQSTFNHREAYLNLLEKVKNENYVITVAELTNNHLGSEKRLKKMISLAKDSGADMIKVQKRDVSSFYTETELSSPYESPFGSTLKEYREGVELTDTLFKVLIEECNNNKIVWFASVLDYPSLRLIGKYNPVLIKLPSTISNHRNYIAKVAKEFKGDVVVSTGFTDKKYESFILNSFLPGRNLFLLQCTSSYPAPPESCQLAVVRHYAELASTDKFSNLIPGYSSHDVGSLGSMLAVSAGAKMIEKHVKLGDVDWIHFDGVAIDLSTGSFKDFVRNVRKAEVMTGSKIKKIHKQEHHKYSPNKESN